MMRMMTITMEMRISLASLVKLKLHGLQMWFVLIVHYDDNDDDDDDDRPYGDEGYYGIILVMKLHGSKSGSS